AHLELAGVGQSGRRGQKTLGVEMRGRLEHGGGGALLTHEAVLVGRWIDLVGTAKPISVGLLASSVAALALLLPEQATVLAILFPLMWVLFSIVLTPATVVLTSSVEAAGEDASFGFAMMNLAFAPGAIVGAVMAGVLRDLSGDLASMALVCVLRRNSAPDRARDRPHE
ncbi:MAG: hypothetical protein LH654_08775, partial [Thermoleophilia bacterium]|nr:hypothetical protein [Thermoleophilia bacterium]